MGLFQDLQNSANTEMTSRNPAALSPVSDSIKKDSITQKFVSKYKNDIKNNNSGILNKIQTELKMPNPTQAEEFRKMLVILITNKLI